MPRTLGTFVENNFSKGRISESTGLTFPQNAVTDDLNCVFHELGYVVRRPGIDFETNYSTKTINRTAVVVDMYYWRNATGDGNRNLVVVQVGATLYFYKVFANETISSGAVVTTVNLDTYKSGTTSAGVAECQYAAGVGWLLVTNPYMNPIYITWNQSTDVATATQITVYIRDTEGVTDTVSAVDERPAALSDAHKYNLYNQGWYVNAGANITAFQASTLAAYPSNADVWWVYKNFDDQFDATTASGYLYIRGTAQAPRGHYLLNAFNQDRATASGIGTITTVSTTARPAACAYFAGRAWYAGVNDLGFETKIYFSQIVEGVDDLGQCYQTSDPTNEDFNELNTADGGWLMIPGAGTVLKLIPSGGTLFVFTTVGIWAIVGGVNGFTAVDYSVNFIGSQRALSSTSFIDVDGYPCWWGVDGIYMLAPSQQGQISVQSLTDGRIRTDYLDIPIASRRFARGAYNPRNKTVHWVYRQTETASLTEQFEFTNVLTFNFLSQGFYFWEVTGTPKIHSLFLTEGFGTVITKYQVVAPSPDKVIVGAGNYVQTYAYSSTAQDFAVNYLVSVANAGSYDFTFAGFTDETHWKDWYTYDSAGIAYDSFFVTGYKVHGEGGRKFQSNYLYVFQDLTPYSADTDFYVRGVWNFSNSTASHKWSNQQRVTKTTGGNFDTVRSKLKIRGHGHALQFRVDSINQAPFKIIGWSAYESANQRD